VTFLPIVDPGVVLTAYAVTRRGRAVWPPLRSVLDRIRAAGDPARGPRPYERPG
jgi:hypothetical protein